MFGTKHWAPEGGKGGRKPKWIGQVSRIMSKSIYSGGVIGQACISPPHDWALEICGPTTVTHGGGLGPAGIGSVTWRSCTTRYLGGVSCYLSYPQPLPDFPSRSKLSFVGHPLEPLVIIRRHRHLTACSCCPASVGGILRPSAFVSPFTAKHLKNGHEISRQREPYTLVKSTTKHERPAVGSPQQLKFLAGDDTTERVLAGLSGERGSGSVSNTGSAPSASFQYDIPVNLSSLT